MPANTSVAKVAIDTRRGKTICCLRAPFLLVVALSGFLSGATYALRMINLDAPERVFLGDTIRLSCYYALQTASGFERAIQTSTRDLYSPSSSSTSSSSYPLVSGGGGGRWQKSNSIQESNYLTSEVFKSATSELTRIAPANEAFRRSTSGSALVNSKQVAANSELLVAASEQLYAVKWYKDDREFFRYLAQGSPKKQRLPMDGLMVDVDRSDNQTVFLRNVSLKTSGQFRCDVTADAPDFMTKSIERKLLVYTQPGEGPKISIVSPQATKATGRPSSGQLMEYSLGDQLDLVCSAPDSKPATSLDWIINDSLNLSAASPAMSTTEGIERWPLLELDNRRLIRLSSPINGSIGEKGPQVVHQLAGKQQPLNQITYELILNNTRAILYQDQQRNKQRLVPMANNHTAQQSIAMAESVLDQLLELSISRLNFTIDTNLLQRLDLTASKLRQKTDRKANSMLRLREIKTRLNPSHETTTDIIGEERFISVGATVSSATNTTGLLAQMRTNLTGLSGLNRTLIKRFADKYPPNPNPTNRAGWIRSQPTSSKLGSIVMNDKLLLKIECVSRFLHWNLSDTVKILINTRKKTGDVDDFNAAAAQKRSRINEKNSARPMLFLASSSWNLHMIILISIHQLHNRGFIVT